MRRTILFGLVQIALSLSLAGVSHAGYVVNVTESGGNVVATGSGTINTTDLTHVGDYSAIPYVLSGIGAIDLGIDIQTRNETMLFTGISGPVSFGSGEPGGSFGVATTSTGDYVGVDGGPGQFYQQSNGVVVPVDYVSGSLLNSSATWTGQTFASLGLTPGTYVWTWGNGVNADSFTLNIGAQAVPEPASILLLGMGSLTIVGYARRRRRATV